MESAPEFDEVIRRWVFDPARLALILAVVAGYVFAFHRSRRSTSVHPAWRLGLFIAGAGVLALALVSPVAHYGRQVLWVDFTGFLLLTMVAPPLLLLGAPLTLAFRTANQRRRRVLRRIYRSRLVAFLTFPVGSWLTFAVVTYLWQFTSLTDLAARNDLARTGQQASLLFVGLLFWMPVIAADPARWRLPFPLRALYVFVEMTHKGLFGGMFLSMNTAMHSGFARNAPAWAPDALADQRMAILILWIGGNMIFVVALIGLIAGWIRYEHRNQQRTDYRLRLQREASNRRRRALDQVFTKGV